jgi:hypothetical protein
MRLLSRLLGAALCALGDILGHTAGSAPPANVRRRLLLQLADDLRAALIAGDIDAAEKIHADIARLLGDAPGGAR